MADEFTLNINDIEYSAKKDETLLQVARRNNIDIPTLCHNEALPAQGSCRLCLVELRWPDWSKLVASCLYPARAGLNVYTASEKVLRTRRMVLELLHARCPDSPEIARLAASHGVTESRFPLDTDGEKCIQCGMCVRACEHVVGVSAIGFQQRGIEREVGTPFSEPSPHCIGCGSCVYVCPTSCIPYEEGKAMRKIWDREFPLQACKACGLHFIPVAQVYWMEKNFGVAKDFFDRCPTCRSMDF